MIKKTILLIFILTVFMAMNLQIKYSVFAYTDLNDEHLYYKAISYITDLGIVQGYNDGTFQPDKTINRAEHLKIVVESIYDNEFESYATESCFTDVKAGEWYTKYVCFAKSRGIVEGYPDGSFQPGKAINFVEALKITMVAFGFEYSQSDPWYRDLIDIASKYNYIPYDIWKFDLDLNRGQMSDIVTRILKDKEGSLDLYLGGNIDMRMTYDSIASSSGRQNITEDSVGLPGNINDIPNVAIHTIPINDPSRSSTGNVNENDAILKFYDQYPDNFDILMFIDLGQYNEKYNGVTNGTIHRYGPLNIGKIEQCSMVGNTNCEGFPSRLRYIQQISDKIIKEIFTHEVAHYWGVGWHTANADECFEPWVSQMLENGHWTELFQAGDTSTLTYPAYFLENKAGTHQLTSIPYGRWIDNHDGTFTKIPIWEDENEGIFNYMDLYDMGLLSEEELALKEMYVVLDPVPVEGEQYTYSAIRRDVTLDDFKKLLKDRETCENTGANYYYTNTGSRDNRGYPEIVGRFNVAMVLIRAPEQTITNRRAREICYLVNKEFPDAWNTGSHYKSILQTYLSPDTATVDCASAFPFP